MADPQDALPGAPKETSRDTPGAPPFLKLRGIAKYFPGVIANEDVSIDFHRGEIHALLGENGAGKSTLMNVVTGLYQPDAGELIVEGYGAVFAAPSAAIAAGIGMVHQHFMLVPRLTVAENLALGWSDTPTWITPAALARRAAELAARFGLAVRPDVRVDTLSAGEQQRVEILRVLSRGARMLILDEPTAVLSPAEVDGLFQALRRFRDAGGAVVIITHKLDEVMMVADRCSVLRGGRLVGTDAIGTTTAAVLVERMIGRPVELPARYPRGADAAQVGTTVLALHDASALDASGVRRLDAVTLEVRAGEVLGIAGVTGNGQPELAALLSGLMPPASGEVVIDGVVQRSADPAAFARLGIGHVPEDRLRTALAPGLSVADNAVLREYRIRPVGGAWRHSATAARRFAARLAEAAQVRLASPTAPIRGLSGGNQQRLVLAREIRVARRALIAAYPARGLDIGAIAAMRARLAALRDQGIGVLLISEDLDEILALSDRIAVLFAGRLMGTMPARGTSREAIGRMMSGGGAAVTDAGLPAEAMG